MSSTEGNQYNKYCVYFFHDFINALKDKNDLTQNERKFLTQLEKGKGVKRNPRKAFKYYELAADLGYTPGLNNLGMCYARGEGVPKNLLKAIKYYKLAANQGSAAAQYNLAMYYKDGDGVEKDTKEADRLFKLAAKKGVS